MFEQEVNCFYFLLPSELVVEGPPRPPSPPLQEYKETAVFLLSSRRPLTSSSSSSRPLSSSSSSGVGGCEGGSGGPHWEDESTSSESKSRYSGPDVHSCTNTVSTQEFPFDSNMKLKPQDLVQTKHPQMKVQDQRDLVTVVCTRAAQTAAGLSLLAFAANSG